MNDKLMIRFLGTGDAMGVPRVYCSCDVCEEARRTGHNRRFRSSLWLENGEGNLLVDCGPDWSAQMEGLGVRQVDQVLITHAHFDHIGGLPELADACRWTGQRARLWAPLEVLDTIGAQFPWVKRHLDFEPFDRGAMMLGWHVRPFKVCHGHNGFSYAYRFERGGCAWVYCPDSIGLGEAEKAEMKQLDLLILGTSYVKEEAPYETRSVYDMDEAMDLIRELEPGAVWFTHMSHGVDLVKVVPPHPSVRLARTGDCIVLH